MADVTVHVGGRDGSLNIRINGPNPTFRIVTDPIRATALADLDLALLDMLEIASAIFAADGSIGRGGATRPHMGIDWRRRFHFRLPVRRVELWRRPDVLEVLKDAVEFLTEDTVDFEFVARRSDQPAQPFLDLDPRGATFDAEEVILFSGGLDSFAGTLELLATTTAKVVLVSHRSAQKVIPRQVSLGKYLADRFKGRVLHVHVPAHRTGVEASDNTQRSRTLLFMAIGQIVARAFGARRLNFFENGIVSQNLPLNPQIVGTMATRTTHPLALKKLNDLVRLISPDPVPIENRYQWLTKTEVVSRIAENGATDRISTAVSCTSIREQTRLTTHCGACSQCLDRRFAILAAGLEAFDPEEIYLTDVLFGERRTDQSRVIAAEWTRHALQLGQLDERGFMAAFGLEASRVVRAIAGQSAQTALNQIRDLHRRHSDAVRQVLTAVIHDRTDDLLNQKISATSLVGMHLGQTGPSVADPLLDPRTRELRKEPLGLVPEVDVVPDPEGHLRVAFFMEGTRPVVAVEGLCRVHGQPARVAHGLRPTFNEDRDEGRSPADYRFIQATHIPGLETLTKDAVRQNVKRCRTQLDEAWQDLHGSAPDGDLLIEGRTQKGYRLDPSIELLNEESFR